MANIEREKVLADAEERLRDCIGYNPSIPEEWYADQADEIVGPILDQLEGAVSADVTDAELDAAWDAWSEAWTRMGGREAMGYALRAFIAMRGR